MQEKQILVLSLLGCVLGAIALLVWLGSRSRMRLERRRRFISTYVFPSELRRRLNEARPELSFGQIDLVLEGLKAYFLACLAAHSGRRLAKQMGMPSRAVDEAWHAFILMTRDYAAFCERAFGRYLHHTPEAQMPEPMDDALANTLHFTRASPMPGLLAAGAAGAAVGAGVPLLFALDRQLGLADGFRYDVPDIEKLDDRR